MTCVAIRQSKAIVCLGGPDHRIRVGDTVYVFEWHSYFGPHRLTKNGDIHSTQPARFLRAAVLWHQQGRHLDEDGMCALVWKPRTKVERVGRGYRVLPDDAPEWDDTVEL